MSTDSKSSFDPRFNRRRAIQTASAGAAALTLPGLTGMSLASAQTPVAENPFGEPASTGGTAVIGIGGSWVPRNFVGTSYYGTNAFFTSKLLYTPLIFLDSIWSTPGPGLAESWEWNDAGTELTMKLRTGVTFHDGEPFTSEDVVFTYKLMVRNDRYPALRDISLLQGGTEYKAGDSDELPGVVAVDDSTVKFTLTSTSNVVELNLSNCGILPAHKFGEDALTPGQAIEELPFFTFDSDFPIGTGPWKITGYDPETNLTLAAFDQYFKGRPVLDELVLRFGISGPSAISGIQAQELDSVFVNAEDAKSLEEVEFLDINANTDLANSTVIITATEKEYLPVPFRQALLHAVNIEAVIGTVLFGYGAPAPSVMMHNSLFPNPDLATYPYDPEKAKALLAEAGWDGSRKLIVGQFTAEGTPTHMQAAIMSMWNEVGVQTEYTPLDPATQADSTASENHPYDVTITSFAWLAYDPSTAYASFATERRPDWSNYSNPQFDEVMSEAIRVPVLADAVPLYQQAAVILQNDLPYAPMWLDPEIWAINKKMHGGSLGRGPLNDIQSELWWKES